MDALSQTYANNPLEPTISYYAIAVMAARAQLGIDRDVVDLTEEQVDKVTELADSILLTWSQTVIEPTIGSAIVIVENAPPSVCVGVCTESIGTYTARVRNMNWEEMKVCARYAYDGFKSRGAPQTAWDWAAQEYPQYSCWDDIRDAYRHCVWSALMTKRGSFNFAKAMGDAHEDGNEQNNEAAKAMDQDNNVKGRDVGVAGEDRRKGRRRWSEPDWPG